MLIITYLNAANLEFELKYDDYEAFERSQLSCTAPLANHYKVVKVTLNGHDIPYTGQFGDLYFHLMKQDLSQYK